MYQQIILVSLAFVLVLILTSLLERQRRFVQLIQKIPGPSGHWLLGNGLDFMVPADEMWKNLRKLSEDYPTIYKYWLGFVPVVNIFTPADIEILCSTTKHITKSRVYECLHPWLNTGLLTSSGAKWQARRKILTPAFHFNVLQEFLPVFYEQSKILVDCLGGECDGPFVDVVPVIAEFTLFSICETAMGTKLDKTDKTTKIYIDAISKMGEITFYRATRPWLCPNFIFWFCSYHDLQRRLVKILHAFSKSVISNRQSSLKVERAVKKKRLAMLDLLISAKNSGQPIDDEGIREEVDTFMFEGHDTTTACICFTLLMLANHRSVQEKVAEEISNVFRDGKGPPTLQDLHSLNYLDLVIKEVLRMFPSVPFIARLTDEEIRTASGYLIPKNCMVHVHIYDLHHDPRIYPDPYEFKPERFSNENVQNRHPFAYIPFSAGPRNCIGQKFAMLEVKTAIVEILKEFVLEAVDAPEDVTMIIHLVLQTKNGIRIKFRRRLI